MNYPICYIGINSNIRENRPFLKKYPSYEELERIQKIQFLNDTIKELYAERAKIVKEADEILGKIWKEK
tara:strand:- start:1155 stop:1361 length:207 start_codon:yes stop_codon:yes gene_type:complete